MTRVCQQGHALESVCDFVGITRQAYYKRIRRFEEKSLLYNKVEQIVIRNRSEKSRAGLRSIYHKENLSSMLGINQFEKEMSQRGHSLAIKKKRIITTDSRGHHYKFDNMAKGLKVSGENQLIVGDITYYEDQRNLFFIFHFVDFYTLELKGLIGSRNLLGENAEKCLRQVLKYNKKSKYEHELILHTDGGGQYRSNKFQSMLRMAQIVPSHAKSCIENGLSERENGILKNEYLIDYEIKDLNHLQRVLKIIQKEINESWPSQALGYKTPRQYAEYMRGIDEDKRPIKEYK